MYPDQPQTFKTPADLADVVAFALSEDLGAGDATSALVDDQVHARAHVVAREPAIVCGTPWFNEVFQQIDPSVRVDWTVDEGESVPADRNVCRLEGKARSLLTGERTALNFLQMLSGTATVTYRYVQALEGTAARILDTRKTIPGLRSAQKYAVRVGGGTNHRFGLYDGILIKENHQYISQSLEAIIDRLPADAAHVSLVEIEIEHLDQLERALNCGVDRIMLDNFSIEDMARAVAINAQRVELEASGNIDLANVREVAQTGVDFISVGAITKNVQAIDYSMMFETPAP